MNRHYENEDRPRKNHYADFDEHGNSLTGNTNSLSRYSPESRYGSMGQRRGESSGRTGHEQQSRNRDTNAAHAYGDYSRGTRYGGGGSTTGGGSSYGHSYYGLSGNQGPGFTQHDRNWSDSRRYDAYGDYGHLRNREEGFSSSFGRSSDGGYMNNDRDRGTQRALPFDESFTASRYRDARRENMGYDRGFGDYGRTGYGATGYNNRDEDRERSVLRNQNQGFANAGNRPHWPEDERYSSERQPQRGRFGRDQDW